MPTWALVFIHVISVASRLVFFGYQPHLNEPLPLTMCIDSDCSSKLSRDVQDHSIGIEWEMNHAQTTVHIPPKDFHVTLEPHIDCYILSERHVTHDDRNDEFEEYPCRFIDVSISFYSRIQDIFRTFAFHLSLHLPDVYPYLMILCISFGVSAIYARLSSPRSPSKPVGVVRIGYFSKCPEFRHVQPHKNLPTKLSGENILKLMVSDPDISSIRISLIANGKA